MTDLSTLKRVVIGRPRANRELKHQLLPKWMALPVFSSDPMSSVAYATEEMMLVLALAGAAAFSLVLPLAFGVATLLTIVIISYRQTVRAYPHGGGAYIVARENLGDVAGLTAASALLIDYTLTVSVSIAAGVAAITSAAPSLAPLRVEISIGFVLLVMFANLRGVKEAGALFALPTYTFVVTMLVLIGTGLVKCIGGCPSVPNPLPLPEAEVGLTVFLILRAFSSGSTALTGVEAISNGVPAFRYPQSRNAASTLAIMGVLAVSMFLGISFLATHIEGITAFHGMPRTVVSQIALAVFGEGFGFYLVAAVTAAILILAANTAYADFPRLASVLAADRFLPRQFIARGDRLVFSNGILVLTALAIVLLLIFNADVTRLIQLYVVGVFTSFTLSQWGMVRHWYTTRERGWRRAAAVNGIGGTTTGVVLVVVAATKFAGGAWIVIVATPLLVIFMARIASHYNDFSLKLRAGVAEPEEPRRTDMIVLFDRIDESLSRAVSYAHGVNPVHLSAIAVPAEGYDVVSAWADFAPNIPMEILARRNGGSTVDALVDAVAQRSAANSDKFTSAVVAERLSGSLFEVATKHRLAVRLKSGLVHRGIVVTNVTGPDAPPLPVQDPVEHHVVVLVSGVHKATMRALAFAEGLHPTTIRALNIHLEGTGTEQLIQEWEDWGVQTPLELLDSPFRSLGDVLRAYVRDFGPDGRHTVVTVVLPEFVLHRAIHRPLHNQTALIIKGALLTEPGVVVTSVPFRLSSVEG